MQMIDETKKENWGGAGFLACALLGLSLIWATGCTNVEWSLKIKDLGDTTEYKENLTTQKGGK